MVSIGLALWLRQAYHAPQMGWVVTGDNGAPLPQGVRRRLERCAFIGLGGTKGLVSR